MLCTVLIGSDTAGQKLIGSTQLLAFLSWWRLFFSSWKHTNTDRYKQTLWAGELSRTLLLTHFKNFVILYCNAVLRGKDSCKRLAERLCFHFFSDRRNWNTVFLQSYFIVFTATSVTSFTQQCLPVGFVFLSSALEGVFLEVLQTHY